MHVTVDHVYVYTTVDYGNALMPTFCMTTRDLSTYHDINKQLTGTNLSISLSCQSSARSVKLFRNILLHLRT